jgi:CheY-like chemotaxis protein
LLDAAMNNCEAILVVDDDSDVRDSLKALLELDGHRTLTASSAEEAIAAIATHQPICVILDLLMPGVGGAELARRIRSERGSEMVLLALTGSVREADQEDAERAGIDYVLHKPLDVSRLRRMLPRVS